MSRRTESTEPRMEALAETRVPPSLSRGSSFDETSLARRAVDDRNVRALCILRLLERHASLSGHQVAELLEGLSAELGGTGRRGESVPYPILHALDAAGLVTRSDERPPRYAITDEGRVEAERLAAAFWPAALNTAQSFAARLALLFPDGPTRARAIAEMAWLGTGT